MASKSAIAFLCVVALLNICAMTSFAIVASFQAKWNVGPTALSWLALAVSVTGILLSFFMLCVSFTLVRFEGFPQLANMLEEKRGIVFAIVLTLVYLSTALLTTISSFTSPGCQDPRRDPHAGIGSSFRDGLSAWCEVKKAGSISFCLISVLWAAAAITIRVRGFPAPEQNDPPAIQQRPQRLPVLAQPPPTPIPANSFLRYPERRIYGYNPPHHPAAVPELQPSTSSRQPRRTQHRSSQIPRGRSFPRSPERTYGHDQPRRPSALPSSSQQQSTSRQQPPHPRNYPSPILPPSSFPRSSERSCAYNQLRHHSALPFRQPPTSNRPPGLCHPRTSTTGTRQLTFPDVPQNLTNNYHTAIPSYATPPRVDPQSLRRLRGERSPPTNVQRPTFDCGVCLETHPENEIIFITPCRHSFCRDCLKRYISSKLRERNCSMVCPTCATDTSPRRPSVITHTLGQQIGISREEYEIWSDLEVATLAINIMCPSCRQTVNYDREEYMETSIIVCPLPNCNHRWCKTCRRSVRFSGVHSCDGSAEMERLVGREGWKRCPGCQTVIQKESGCNHMTCTSQGCNVHFCYRCGELIIRSTLRMDITLAVTEHFRSCQMFDR